MVLTVVRSKYLDSLTKDEKDELKKELFERQKGKCFICEEVIDLKLQQLDIDHVTPLNLGGKDEKNNFALTHLNCNREKQDANLEVARIAKKFDKIKDDVYKSKGIAPDLSNILEKFGGSKYELPITIDNERVKFSLDEVEGNQKIYDVPIYEDRLSDTKSFFVNLPIEYIFHDEKGINPRKLSDRVKELIKEFYVKRPQLQIGLARVNLDENQNKSKVFIFDGQHKAAAQILLGSRKLLLRVFLNPDLEILAQTNERAGSDLRQIAFDKSVIRHLGATILAWKVENFQKEKGLTEDDYSFSEKDLINHYRGEGREVKKFILDWIRNRIITHQDNKLKDYINYGGREKDKPVSYSSIEKTFFSIFLYQDLLDVRPFDNIQRQHEINQIVKLMNLIVEEILKDYNFELGSWRIEDTVRKEREGSSSLHIPDEHLKVIRMVKEELMFNWLKLLKQIIQTYFNMQGIPVDEDRLFQQEFPDVVWDNVRNFLKNLKDLPIWVDREKTHIFSAKQTYDYWSEVFRTGKSPDNVRILSEGLNLMNMIKP